MFFCASLLNLCPVNVGLVPSLGGNVTGINVFTGVMKGLGLFTEMVPGVALIAIMVNPANPQPEASAKEIQSMPRTPGSCQSPGDPV
jgi:ABC-type uncharacterized transport system substrate-binding protein